MFTRVFFFVNGHDDDDNDGRLSRRSCVFCVTLPWNWLPQHVWNRKSTNAKRWWDDKRSIRFFHRYLPYAVYINRLRSVRFRYCFCRTPERVEVKLTAGLSRLLLLVFWILINFNSNLMKRSTTYKHMYIKKEKNDNC